MNFIRWFFSRRSNKDWSSWYSLVITIPAIVGVIFVVPRAIREHSAASRQQTDQGLVIVSAISHRDKEFVSILIAVIAALAGIILFSKLARA